MRAFACLALLAAPAAAQEPPDLAFPLDCTLGVTCHVQQYVDRDPGPGALDYLCGARSYDGHQGTDFRLNDTSDLDRAVAVLAVADGTVTATRDGVADGGIDAAPEGQECGNGVVVTHRDGWSSQYCHLAEGSLAVTDGDEVSAGDRLGAVGLSGQTEFPHLHVTIRNGDTVVDPFRPDSADGCAEAPTASLWIDPPAYVAGGFLTAGFADAVPSYADVRAGTADADKLTTEAEAMVVWAYFFGNLEGDEIRAVVTGPDGAVVFDNAVTLDRAQSQAFRGLGRTRPPGGWPVGTYRGRITLSRDGTVQDTIVTTLRIVPPVP